MKRTDRELNTIIDDVTGEIRHEKLDSAVVGGAAQRVWTRLTGEQAAEQAGITPVDQLRDCDDFQALIPAYLQGYLSSARTMLLEDHVRECVPCRRAMKEARSGNQTARELEVQRARVTAANYRMTVMRWGIAAVLVIGFGMLAWPWVQRFTNSVNTLNAIVEASQGNVYRVTDNRNQAIKAGDKLERGERIRTAKNSTAVVKLSDGTLVEMRERAEFSISRSPEGTTINLERGNIIVEAAKQRDGKLYVATDDALVSVTGTIFSVNNGTKGARVSVIEGEVHVDQAGRNRVLHPGDQVTTHDSIERIPIQDEVKWSRNSDSYNNLLAAAEAARKQIDAAVSMPGNRYSTRLLDMMPDETAFYVAIPNISTTLAEANRILQENIGKSPELNQWWQEERSRARGGSGTQGAIELAQEIGSYLGDEIAIGAASGLKGGDPQAPVILAELRDANGLRAFIDSKLAGTGEAREHLRIIDDPLAVAAPAGQAKRDQINIWIYNDLLAASPRIETLKTLATRVRAQDIRTFASSPFRSHIAGLYRDGAGLLIAADLEKLIGRSFDSTDTATVRSGKAGRGKDSALAKQLGVTDLRYFVVEVKEKNGQPFNRAVVSFRENQHGLTSWLATPGPMGALEFISPDANLVAAFVVKEPTALVDDLLNALQTADPEAWQKLQNFQAEQGIDLRTDLATPLGGEYAFAIDGPLLPIPSWKAVFEVDDPVHLQQTFERTVEKLNAALVQEGKQGFVWAVNDVGDKKFYTLKSLDYKVEVNYAYAYGYLIAAPSRALVENAIKYRESGFTLLQSAKFKATLPEDKQANFSAMLYQNLGSVVGPLARQMGRAATKGGPKETRGMLEGLLGGKAGLAYVYALNDRMIFSVNTEDGPLGISPSTLLGLPGSSGLGHIMKEAGR